MARTLLSSMAFPILVQFAHCQDPEEARRKAQLLLDYQVNVARNHVKAHLKSKGEIYPPPIRWIDEKNVRTAFPSYKFFAVRYPKNSATWRPPIGVAYSSLVAIRTKGDGNAEVHVLSKYKQMKKFFKEQWRSPTGRVTPEEAAAALLGWLRLTRELKQTGRLRFRQYVSHIQLQGTGRVPQVPTLTGKTVVSTGGVGEVMVTIDFSTVPRIEHIIVRDSLRVK